VFATVYALMSATLTARIGAFASRDWAAAYAVAFANLYRDAFIAFELGTPAQVPKAWALSFDVSRRGDGLVLPPSHQASKPPSLQAFKPPSLQAFKMSVPLRN
jgi:hypothetical protein